MFTRLYGFETVTIRYFNVFGPRQDPGSPYSGVISLFATALLEGRQPVIYGDGEQTRDFTYIANVVDGVLRACEAPQAAGEVINVATGGRISLNELLQHDEPDRRDGHRGRSTRSREQGDVRDSQADISKARRCSVTCRSSASKTVCAGPWSGAGRRSSAVLMSPTDNARRLVPTSKIMDRCAPDNKSFTQGPA